ncbi:unnamed protein product [Rhodiola kirilowii]
MKNNMIQNGLSILLYSMFDIFRGVYQFKDTLINHEVFHLTEAEQRMTAFIQIFPWLNINISAIAFSYRKFIRAPKSLGSNTDFSLQVELLLAFWRPFMVQNMYK